MHVLDGDGMMTAIDGQDPTIMYASQPYGTFYRSSNSGNNWQRISRSSQHGEPGRCLGRSYCHRSERQERGLRRLYPGLQEHDGRG